jgi:hypothetical protein
MGKEENPLPPRTSTWATTWGKENLLRAKLLALRPPLPSNLRRAKSELQSKPSRGPRVENSPASRGSSQVARSLGKSREGGATPSRARSAGPERRRRLSVRETAAALFGRPREETAGGEQIRGTDAPDDPLGRLQDLGERTAEALRANDLNFGTYIIKVVRTEARSYRNPRTGAPIWKEASNRMRFVPSKTFKEGALR